MKIMKLAYTLILLLWTGITFSQSSFEGKVIFEV